MSTDVSLGPLRFSTCRLRVRVQQFGAAQSGPFESRHVFDAFTAKFCVCITELRLQQRKRFDHVESMSCNWTQGGSK